MNRIIVITGTRKGLGKLLCEYFLNDGDIVYGCSRRKSSIDHPAYMHFCLSVSDEQSVISMVRKIYQIHKKIDILLNNAGIASMNHFLLTPYSTAQQIFETNFFGTLIMCREVSKLMVRRKYGKIVNFSTVAVPLHLEGELVYSSSKAAIEQLTKVLAAELGSFNITVNAVGPTPINTDLIAHVPEEKINKLIQKQSLKRLGNFADVLNVIKFYIDENSNFITGQIIYLGGIN